MPPSPTSSAGASCPQCRTANAQGARFCQQCGTSLMPATCGACRASIAPGAKFCQQCGTATQA
nr:zinc ribbon domain-containing protein [Paraburkholderia sp. BL27I4N3]